MSSGVGDIVAENWHLFSASVLHVKKLSSNCVQSESLVHIVSARKPDPKNADILHIPLSVPVGEAGISVAVWTEQRASPVVAMFGARADGFVGVVCK